MTSEEPEGRPAREPLASAAEVAAYLRVEEKTLANWRARKKGPRYRIVGRETRYDWKDVDAYVKSIPVKGCEQGDRPAA